MNPSSLKPFKRICFFFHTELCYKIPLFMDRFLWFSTAIILKASYRMLIWVIKALSDTNSYLPWWRVIIISHNFTKNSGKFISHSLSTPSTTTFMFHNQFVYLKVIVSKFGSLLVQIVALVVVIIVINGFSFFIYFFLRLFLIFFLLIFKFCCSVLIAFLKHCLKYWFYLVTVFVRHCVCLRELLFL